MLLKSVFKDHLDLKTNVQFFTILYIRLVQPKLIHSEQESGSPTVTMTNSLSLCCCQFSENNSRNQHVTKGKYILNGFDEELHDRFNDKHIERWSVVKALLPENDAFLNCTVLGSLLEYVSSIPLYSEILVPHSSTRLASECTIYKT